MDQSYRQLIEFLLPQGLLAYFDLIKTTQSPNGLHITSKRKTSLLLSITIESCIQKASWQKFGYRIRENKVTLVIKRRRWEDVTTNDIITRDWNVVSDGARITKEFGLFLKEAFGRKSR